MKKYVDIVGIPSWLIFCVDCKIISRIHVHKNYKSINTKYKVDQQIIGLQ